MSDKALTEEELRELRKRAHVHTDGCYGVYEPCGEHHAHDEHCGSRSLVCRMREDRLLVKLLSIVDAQAYIVHLEIEIEKALALADHARQRWHRGVMDGDRQAAEREAWDGKRSEFDR